MMPAQVPRMGQTPAAPQRQSSEAATLAQVSIKPDAELCVKPVKRCCSLSPAFAPIVLHAGCANRMTVLIWLLH